MDEKFMIGIVLGMLGGALLVTNCSKARKLVKEGQACVKQKMDMLEKSGKSDEEQE